MTSVRRKSESLRPAWLLKAIPIASIIALIGTIPHWAEWRASTLPERSEPLLAKGFFETVADEAAFLYRLGARAASFQLFYGTILTRAKRPEKGIPLIQAAALLEPQNPMAHLILADAYQAAADCARAAPHYEIALKSDRKLIGAGTGLAQCLLSMQKGAEASAVLEETARANPDSVQLREHMFKVHEKLEDRLGAARDIAELVRLKPDRLDYWRIHLSFLAENHSPEGENTLASAKMRFPAQAAELESTYRSTVAASRPPPGPQGSAAQRPQSSGR